MEGSGRYERALARVVAQVQAEFGADLLGILFAGSVAYGNPMAGSDLDFYVIIRSPWRQRRLLQVDGIEVDLFINPVSQIRAEFGLTDHPSTIHMFAHGRILHDPENIMADLAGEARRIWERGRPGIPPEDLWRVRYMPADLLNDSHDLLDVDKEAATHLLHRTLEATIDAHYRIQPRWPVKPKYLLADLSAHAPALEILVRRVLDGHLPTIERWEALQDLVDRVLLPIGGRSPEWRSEIEPVEQPPPG
jgi:predicted nucleotidyltransferase